jgi:hypothetical protein
MPKPKRGYFELLIKKGILMDSIIKKIEEFLSKKYCLFSMAGCIVISTVITIIETVIGIFNIDYYHTLNDTLINIRVFFIYLAAGSLVGLLAELRIRLKKVENKTIRNFCNRFEARPVIEDCIKNAALKNEKDPLEIKVYGWRLTQNIDSIRKALDEVNISRKKQFRNIIIYLYYSDYEFLDILKTFNDDASFTNMVDDQKKCIRENMQKLKDEIGLNKYDFVKIRYRKHFDTPQFWVIQIGSHDIFWGYFTLTEENDNDIERLEGSLNSCFRFKDNDLELDGFFVWINNVFDRLEKWSKKA